MIKQTAEIFEILSKGGFISSDSTNPNIRQLYAVIEDNQSELYDFFAAINFILESGNEYYYFSRQENKVDLERKLEIARALATNPKLLLLDEPAAGMNPNETKELMETIRFVRDKFDMTVLLIEHDMKLVSGICEELTVLNFGQELAQGETSAVLNDPKVITAYLGE